MEQTFGLLGDGADDLWMRMAGGAHRDAGVQVEEDVAVDILHHRPCSPRRNEPVGSRKGRTGDAGVGLDQLAGPRAGHLRDQAGLGEPRQFGVRERGLQFQLSPR